MKPSAVDGGARPGRREIRRSTSQVTAMKTKPSRRRKVCCPWHIGFLAGASARHLLAEDTLIITPQQAQAAEGGQAATPAAASHGAPTAGAAAGAAAEGHGLRDPLAPQPTVRVYSRNTIKELCYHSSRRNHMELLSRNFDCAQIPHIVGLNAGISDCCLQIPRQRRCQRSCRNAMT